MNRPRKHNGPFTFNAGIDFKLVVEQVALWKACDNSINVPDDYIKVAFASKFVQEAAELAVCREHGFGNDFLQSFGFHISWGLRDSVTDLFERGEIAEESFARWHSASVTYRAKSPESRSAFCSG